MSAILQLWLPILTTAVLIFIASSLIHMVFKWHNADYKKLANEDDVLIVEKSTGTGSIDFTYQRGWKTGTDLNCAP